MANQVPKSKKNAIEIDKGNPFKNCKLGREKYAQVLTSIVQNYSDGFVLAINNEWGTGKTTFIKMWEQHLKNEKFTTLHFNAWKTDFSSNPFIALISQLGMLKKSKVDKVYKGFLEKSVIFIKKLGPGLLKGLAKKHIDDSELLNLIKVGAEITADDLEKRMKKQLEVESDIDDFRTALKNLVGKASSDKPIVFIIDELDRCRPDYAVAVLEQIKHFFAIDGIVFVLAIDKEQLGHAVRGVYGSDKINADEYLRRFIDLEYSIPDPEYKDYCAYLYDYFKFDEFLASEKRMVSELSKEKNHFINFASSFFSKNKLTLRLLEKIFFRARIAMNLFKESEYTFPGVYIYLLYLKFSEEDFYKNIIDKKLTINELAAKIEKNIDFKQTDNDLYFFLFTESCLLSFYRNYYNKNTPRDSYIEWLLNSDGELQFKSGLEKEQLIDGLVRNISFISQNNYSDLSLSHLINKIELTENFVSTDTEK